jgi:subtilase family serine protease
LPTRIKAMLFYASLIAGASLSTTAWAADNATVPGNVSSWVATAARTGSAPDSQAVTIAVHMRLRDLKGLRGVVADVSDPKSASYGHYLTPATLKSRFGPEAADVAAVEAVLKSAGMKQVVVGPANAYVSAVATVGQLRSTFGVTQDIYRYGTKTVRANREAPVIPAALTGKVLFIEGLDDSSTMKVPNHVSATLGALKAPAGYKPSLVAHAQVTTDASPASVRPAAVTPPPVALNIPSPYCSNYYGQTVATLSTKPAPYSAKLPWLVCGYTPQQIQKAYGLDLVKPTGTGVTVAILDAYASPTMEADANRYAAKHSLPALTSSNFTQIIPQGIYDVDPTETCGPYGWWGEESLDVSAVHGAAPGANIVYIGARDCGTALTVALLNAIYNYQADVLTNSYSFNGEAVDPATTEMQDQSFMAAAAQGQTVLFSSGDDGDLSQINGVAGGSFEATSPYVTGVGGTSLALMNAKGSKSEWGWGTDRAFLADATVNSAKSITTSGVTQTTNFGLTYGDFSFYGGSGGGISLIEPQPSYQAGVVPTALATTLWEASGYGVTLPTLQRVSPDVAMVADPYTGYLVGETYTIAGDGTSDIGCEPTSTTTEYCEYTIGGTSLASPLMAGMIAVMNEARLNTNKPLVGFVNPLLYGLKLGTTLTSAAINDVNAPASPTAVLRGYVNDDTRVRLITMNSAPFVIYLTPFPLVACSLTICEGLNDVFNFTTPGYDDVTGLGVPYAPYLVKQ